jgi:hypothetical protein
VTRGFNSEVGGLLRARGTAAPQTRLAGRGTRRSGECCEELLRAELAGELSEFEALRRQAVLAMAEGSALAIEYLEMAEAAAASPEERALVAEHRVACALLRGASGLRRSRSRSR